MNQEEFVVLVDEQGNDLLNQDGSVKTANKLEAHRQGLLHKAVSVFIINENDQILLQQRAPGKYHTPRKWSNTCCTHPFLLESPIQASSRRLLEEMGITCNLKEIFTTRYKYPLDNDLIEHEFSHIFIGYYNENPMPNSEEVISHIWKSMKDLMQDMEMHSDLYTPWFVSSIRKVYDHHVRTKLDQIRFQKDKLSCFIICPLGDDDMVKANLFRDKIVWPVIKEFGFDEDIQRADTNHSDVSKENIINSQIMNADLVVADLTHSNPNVFYELGMRHSIGGMCVQFTRDELSTLKFDIRQKTTIKYGTSLEEEWEPAKESFRQELHGQFKAKPKPLPLDPVGIIRRFSIAALLGVYTKDRDQYALACNLVRKQCTSLFLMQRSSTMILGPRFQWEDESSFYKLIYSQISKGVNFLHIVDTEGMSLHYSHEKYPQFNQALSCLGDIDGYVGIKSGNNHHVFKKNPESQNTNQYLIGSQARVLIGQFQDGSTEAILVANLGNLQVSLHFGGNGLSTLWEECMKYYNQCPKLELHDITEKISSCLDR